jgi:hypothetical protein
LAVPDRKSNPRIHWINLGAWSIVRVA